MITNHRIFFKDAKYIFELEDNSVDLVVTSPPSNIIQNDLKNYKKFIMDYNNNGKIMKHKNEVFNLPVVTQHEKDLLLLSVCGIQHNGWNELEVSHEVLRGIIWDLKKNWKTK